MAREPIMLSQKGTVIRINVNKNTNIPRITHGSNENFENTIEPQGTAERQKDIWNFATDSYNTVI